MCICIAPHAGITVMCMLGGSKETASETGARLIVEKHPLISTEFSAIVSCVCFSFFALTFKGDWMLWMCPTKREFLGQGDESMCLPSAWQADTVQPAQSGVRFTSGGVWCGRVLKSVIWIIDCMCKGQKALDTYHSLAHGPLSQAWSFDTSAYKNDGYKCGPEGWHSCSADNSWAPLCMEPIPSKTDRGVERRGALRRYLTFPL